VNRTDAISCNVIFDSHVAILPATRVPHRGDDRDAARALPFVAPSVERSDRNLRVRGNLGWRAKRRASIIALLASSPEPPGIVSSDASVKLASGDPKGWSSQVQVAADASRQLFVNFWGSETASGGPRQRENAL
jgi:hypothetical protein